MLDLDTFRFNTLLFEVLFFVLLKKKKSVVLNLSRLQFPEIVSWTTSCKARPKLNNCRLTYYSDVVASLSPLQTFLLYFPTSVN